MGSQLLLRVRRALARAGDPRRAEGARAYMKSAMPFHGVSTDALRRVCREVFDGHPLATSASWRRDVLAIWRGARFREERYAAIELTGEKRAASFQDLRALPMYEEMIVTGAWWDYVDVLAAKRLGTLLTRYPKDMRKTMLAWSRGKDVWKRRSAILCQLTFKGRTDLGLLYGCIEPSLEPEAHRVAKDATELFFLRKGIGWALRQYAWTDPGEIARYVAEQGDDLSGLSRREALKNASPRKIRSNS